jgi:hypothetical protein
LTVVHLGGEGTRLRREVKKLNVTSHQKLRTVSVTSVLSAGSAWLRAVSTGRQAGLAS